MDITSFGRRSGYPRQPERSNTRSPLSKAASMGLAYVHQSSYPAAMNSQPQVPSPKTYVTDGFTSLPRPKRTTAQPAQRRKEVNNVLQGYLKSLGSMARSIELEKETVKQEHLQWTSMDDAAKEEVVNDHFIPQDIRLQYSFDFPIDRSVSRVSHCSVPPSWPSRPHSAHSMHDGMFQDESSFSQPNDWEGEYRQRRQLPGSSQEDLSYREHRGNNLVHGDTSLSLSQPSLSYSYDNVDSTPTPTFNRLHKQQLSFRPSRKQHAVKPLPSSQVMVSKPPPPRRGLGSDGESPRNTSDEDFESRNSHHHLELPQLGFQRSKLRSYSMRSRRGPSASRGTSARGSMRTQRRKPASPENNQKNYGPTDPSSRPSHYHTYSNTSTDTDYDAEIDLPDASLLLDHVQASGSSEKQPDSRLHRRNSRTRRSLKGTPKLVLNQPSPPSTLTRQATLDSSIDDLDIDDLDIDESVLDDPLPVHRTNSRDSLDTMNPSTLSKSSYPQSDDDALSTTASEISRMTPDSMLSCASFRPTNKQAELAVLRNRRGKWGGSSYRHVTSNFAERHTQFKPNRLHGNSSVQTSASTTRASSPMDLIMTTSSTDVKPPRFSKYGSATESVTSDLPRSPDHLISPPTTPSAMLASNATYLFSDKRESGYISSSSESFPIRR